MVCRPDIKFRGVINVRKIQIHQCVDCKIVTKGSFKIQFPYVTRWIYVVNKDPDSDLRVGFSENGVNGTNYFTVMQHDKNSGAAGTFLELKLSQLWLSGSDDCDVLAGLTSIPTARIDNISPSGSNWSGSYDGQGGAGFGLG